eukprot:XP_011677015.1 PREDICTED: cytochrome P450 2U1-like [Strongylocentrotus purpuratus]
MLGPVLPVRRFVSSSVTTFVTKAYQHVLPTQPQTDSPSDQWHVTVLSDFLKQQTTDTLRWAILIAAQHPQLVHEVQKEIDDVIGGRSPKFSDQSLMPLTGATMLEITRIRPVVPLGVPRCTSRDAVVQGYHIPKNTTVLMNLWELQTSPKYWKEPDKFNPYRFLSEDHKTIVSHRALNPFGIGLRVCLGEKLARMQLFIIFTSLLQRFTLRLADDSLSVGMEGKAGLAYGPLDYNIVLEKRNV